MTPSELLDLARTKITVGLEISNRAIGVGRSLGYQLAKQGRYPVRVLRLGTRYHVRTADLVAFLGITQDVSGGSPRQETAAEIHASTTDLDQDHYASSTP